jgi:hypothetical protein
LSKQPCTEAQGSKPVLRHVLAMINASVFAMEFPNVRRCRCFLSGFVPCAVPDAFYQRKIEHVRTPCATHFMLSQVAKIRQTTPARDALKNGPEKCICALHTHAMCTPASLTCEGRYRQDKLGDICARQAIHSERTASKWA